jgi:hypothetical protein
MHNSNTSNEECIPCKQKQQGTQIAFGLVNAHNKIKSIATIVSLFTFVFWGAFILLYFFNPPFSFMKPLPIDDWTMTLLLVVTINMTLVFFGLLYTKKVLKNS